MSDLFDLVELSSKAQKCIAGYLPACVLKQSPPLLITFVKAIQFLTDEESYLLRVTVDYMDWRLY